MRWRWWCAPTASRANSAATSRVSRRARRCTTSASITSGARRATTIRATCCTSRAIQLARRLRARLSRRPLQRRTARPFPHGSRRQGHVELVSASLADAGFLADADGVDGPRSDHRDLPGALLQVPGTPRPDAPSDRKVWCFIGDGESDEPESLGAISLAGREGLDNLIFVINCNLQRLDGPVRGNGKIIQELEGVFRGAGWNVHQGGAGAVTGIRCSRATPRACCAS